MTEAAAAASLCRVTIIRRLLIAAALISVAAAPQPSGWRTLWNGKNLDGWTTWMQNPSPTSDVPGLKRDDNGRYLEPIGSGRDPLKVFTDPVAFDVGIGVMIANERVMTKTQTTDQTGGASFGLPLWEAGVPPSSPEQYCQSYKRFAGGEAWLTQYSNGDFDIDTACP